MRSGVSRQRVRSRRRWRMISWPAAKLIRWVNPSIATVSPSRTSAAIASAMVATFVVTAEVSGTGPSRVGRESARRFDARDRTRRGRGLEDVAVVARDVADGLAEDPERGLHLADAHRQGGGHPDRGLPALQDEQAALERGP